MANLGNRHKVYMTASAASEASAADWLVGETSNSLSLNANLIEISDKSSAYQSYIPGIKGGSCSVTINTERADTKQQALLAALVAGTKVYGFVGELGGSGVKFAAYVASISESNDNASVSTTTVELTFDGEFETVAA